MKYARQVIKATNVAFSGIIGRAVVSIKCWGFNNHNSCPTKYEFLSDPIQSFSLDPFLQKGSSLQVENLSVCLSSLQDFEYRPFISSQDHARPHILYTDGQRMMSAVIWRCQWHTQRQIQRQIHRQRQIQSASKTKCMLYFWRAGNSRISNITWTWTCRTWPWWTLSHGRGGHVR